MAEEPVRIDLLDKVLYQLVLNNDYRKVKYDFAERLRAMHPGTDMAVINGYFMHVLKIRASKRNGP